MKVAINLPFTKNRIISIDFNIKKILRNNIIENNGQDNSNNFNPSAPKIFCIGRNKTGTTSLEKALADLRYKMGDQAKGELLLKDYGNRNWDPIISFCHTADAFQDGPFSWPFTWLVLHKEFPNARFILTVREANDWYRSLTSFHAKLFTDGKRIPTKEDLLNAEYRYRGYMWEANRIISQTPENNIYDKKILVNGYNRHNDNIRQYFKENPNFLEIDVSQPDSYEKLCNFLGQKPVYSKFPHLNKT